jgi:hypothetical protein
MSDSLEIPIRVGLKGLISIFHRIGENDLIYNGLGRAY